MTVEQLEERRMLATFTVTNIGDGPEGSLRQAVSDANANPGADEIVFDHRFLDGSRITIVDPLELTEPVLIDASTLNNSVTIDGLNVTGLFLVSASGTYEFRGLTLTGGSSTFGAAIATTDDANASIDIRDSVISGNTASHSGGGVSVLYGSSAYVRNTIFSDNSASLYSGGAILNYGSVTVIDSTFRGNSAEQSGGALHNAGFSNGNADSIEGSSFDANTARNGGAIFNSRDAVLAMLASTVSGNVVSYSGGGIYNTGRASIDSSTISGNTAFDYGGGVYNFTDSICGPTPCPTTLTIANSTITNNFATDGGGGIDSNLLGGSFLALSHTIVSGNRNADVDDNLSVNPAETLTEDSHNLIDVDPMLGPLADNGGPTLTHALLIGSPAIDAGDPAFVSNGINDQRGQSRIKNGRVDIGAVESDPLTVPDGGLIVSNNSDILDGDFSPGQLSLREAVEIANSVPAPDTITFADTLSNATITLGGTELWLTDTLVIDASSLSSNVTIDANGQSRIFNIDGGTPGAGDGGIVTLSHLNLVNGSAPNAEGGAILANGSLTLRDSTVANSQAEDGGGISNSGGSITITRSTISGNSARRAGGGLLNAPASAAITNSTFSGNSANFGAGIHHAYSGLLTISHSTITANSANLSVGGLLGANSDVSNSIIAGNTAPSDPNVAPGTLSTGSFNLVDVEVSLSPLADNGGPTLTHSLLPWQPDLS